ncbi:AIPR family protein [Thomasclavelia cocleata]|uniref:AIPR family protein n=1 Tax=Thomasclavelia cocleata TaxID=69824 RepID=UPI00257827E5|nr:AIPR family protein [Thomasclavelia cocleata]
MDRIVQSYIDDFLKSQQIDEKDSSKQFEMFSSYCAVAQQYTEVFDLNDILTGAGGDCGIDGIAIIANGTIISSKEEVDDLIELNKGLSDMLFVFIQSKTSSGFSSGEMGTFGAGVVDFFSETPQFVRNQFIQEKSDLINYIFSKAVHFKSKPCCFLYYVTTGKWVDDQNCVARKNMIIHDLEELDLFKEVQFIPVDVKLIQKYYRNTIDVIETEIDFSQKVLLPDIPKIKQSYLGYVDYEEYLKLIVGDNGEIRKNVFYDNVRDYQGDNEVNIEIAETIKSASNKFILLNNGVTIICKKLTNLRNKFTLTDYQIVNGCQTSHVLYYNKEFINGNLQIPIKLIETLDEDTVNNIIKATNRQTQVTNEQLIALNEFHRQLEAFYQTFSGTQKLYYERRSKQYNYMTEVEKVRIVTISTQIKAAAAMFFDKPHLASRYYGRLLKSVDGIFNEEHKLSPYYTCAYLLYKLEYLFRNKLLPAQYRKFRYHILMLIKYDFSDGKVPNLNSNKIENVCKKILECANDNVELQNEVERMIAIINKHITDASDTESTKSASLIEELKLEVNK